MKTLSKTVTTTIEVESTPIVGSDKFVIVHIKTPYFNTNEMPIRVMLAQDFHNAKSPDDIKNYKFQMPHQIDTDYSSYFVPVSFETLNAIKAGNYGWYDVHDDYLPDFDTGNFEVIGVSPSDTTFCDIDGKYINRPIIDSFLNKYYDIYAIEKNEKDILIPENKWTENFIYYVPGNGHTINLGIRLKDEQYAEYLKLDWYEKSKYLIENTVLGKYKRENRVDEDNED